MIPTEKVFVLIVLNRTQFMMASITLTIRPSSSSGRCLKIWQKKKRENSFVRKSKLFTCVVFGVNLVSVIRWLHCLHWPLSPLPDFVTGCVRVPFCGMKQIRMTVAVLPNANEVHIPEALTCHYLLSLPNYQRYPVSQTMHTKLLQAINDKNGLHQI